jgi:hypothetical protein
LEAGQHSFLFDTCKIEGFYTSPLEHVIEPIEKPFVVRKISGQLTSRAGEWPPGGVLFELRKLGEERILSTRTDTHGFYFLPVKKGVYCFKATLDGWQSRMGIAIVSGKADRATRINFSLYLD